MTGEYILGSNPLVPDTDGDGYSDLEEYEVGTSPEDRFTIRDLKTQENPKAQTDSPDGRLYQIHHPTDGHHGKMPRYWRINWVAKG